MGQDYLAGLLLRRELVFRTGRAGRLVGCRRHAHEPGGLVVLKCITRATKLGSILPPQARSIIRRPAQDVSGNTLIPLLPAPTCHLPPESQREEAKKV